MKTKLLLALLASAAPTLPALAQATAFTTSTRYDADRRLTGTISPDPDGIGPMKIRASRNVHDAAGRLIRTERGTLDAWQPEAVAPPAWPGFVVLEAQDFAYDALDRRTRETRSGASPNGQVEVQTVTQMSYDLLGRLECTAVRMNRAAYGALPASACVLGPEGGFGPDRIVRNVYDAAGQLLQVREAVGTLLEQSEATYRYSANGKRVELIDGNGNRSAFRLDGHDRLVSMVLPSPARPAAFDDSTPASAHASAGAVNEGDYEAYTLDGNGNRTWVRLRDGQVVVYGWDALNRMADKTLPGGAWDSRTEYRYDHLNRLTYANYPGSLEFGFAYDNAGRKTAEGSNWYGETQSQYDADGNRTRLTYRDGFAVDYAYLATGEMSEVREAGGFVLASFGYDGLGRRTRLDRGNGRPTTYAHDGASRLTALSHDLAGDAYDLASTFAYSPASQIVEAVRGNDAYAFTNLEVADYHSPANGLNQLANVNGLPFVYDARGNLTQLGDLSWGYSADNRLRVATSAGAPGVNMAYDPTGRLIHIDSSLIDFRYDGDQLLEESHAGTATLRRRFVHGPGVDEPIASYDVAGNRSWYHADERGSIVATSDGSGNATGINTYDEYGAPGANNVGRFSYTGQLWLPEVQLYSYKARMREPRLDRFMQTDPIGYDDGPNWYVYAGGDPVNATDPSGMDDEEIVVIGRRPRVLGIIVPGTAENKAWATEAARQTERGFRELKSWIGSVLSKEVDIDDPDSLEGVTEEEVEEAAKAKGYTEREGGSRRGGGRVYEAGNGSDQVRTMPGGGNRTGEHAAVKEGGPYVEVSKHGSIIVRPLAGNRTLRTK